MTDPLRALALTAAASLALSGVSIAYLAAVQLRQWAAERCDHGEDE